MPHITRHLLVPEAPQADTHESLVGAGGCRGSRGGSEPSRRAPRARGAYVLGEGVGWVNYVTTQRVAHGRAARGRAVPDAATFSGAKRPVWRRACVGLGVARPPRADPGGAPARARPERRLSERGGWLSIYTLCSGIQKITGGLGSLSI